MSAKKLVQNIIIAKSITFGNAQKGPTKNTKNMKNLTKHILERNLNEKS